MTNYTNDIFFPEYLPMHFNLQGDSLCRYSCYLLVQITKKSLSNLQRQRSKDEGVANALCKTLKQKWEDEWKKNENWLIDVCLRYAGDAWLFLFQNAIKLFPETKRIIIAEIQFIA